MASTVLNSTVYRTYDGPAESGDPAAISVDYFYRNAWKQMVKHSSRRGGVAIQDRYSTKLANLATLNP